MAAILNLTDKRSLIVKITTGLYLWPKLCYIQYKAYAFVSNKQNCMSDLLLYANKHKSCRLGVIMHKDNVSLCVFFLYLPQETSVPS